MINDFTMKDSLEKVEQGTLIFWDPVIQRALTDQASLQWICSAKPVFGRIYDLCVIAKVGEGWYLSDRPEISGLFAFPGNIRFASNPEIILDQEVEIITPLQRKRNLEDPFTSQLKKICFVQRLEIPRGKKALGGLIFYDVFKNEMKQPTGRTHFNIVLKD